MQCDELEGSELGTQEYWDKTYETEVANFRNHKDVGEIWFGEDTTERIVTWMEKNVTKTQAVLDVGCGNGMLLVHLAATGFSNLHGVDYSKDAVTLAREVAAHHDADVDYTVGDILKGDIAGDFDVVLDKGTYDAVSLSSDAKSNRESYIRNVHKCLKDNGWLAITSCNWTKDELAVQFEGLFKVYCVIPTPTFKFGGKVGSVVLLPYLFLHNSLHIEP